MLSFLKAFTNFLKLEFADENISFYESSEHLKIIRDSYIFISAFLCIKKRFLTRGAEKGIFLLLINIRSLHRLYMDLPFLFLFFTRNKHPIMFEK